MQSLLQSVGLGGLVPSRVNVPAAPALNLRNNAHRRLNFGAQHPPGGEPEMVEENINVTVAPEAMVDAVEVMSPPGNGPTMGGRRRKASRKSRKASRKSRKASRKSRKASRKASRKSRKGAKRN